MRVEDKVGVPHFTEQIPQDFRGSVQRVHLYALVGGTGTGGCLR